MVTVDILTIVDVKAREQWYRSEINSIVLIWEASHLQDFGSGEPDEIWECRDWVGLGAFGPRQRNLPPLIPNSQSYHQPSDDNSIRKSPLNPQRNHSKWRTSSPRPPDVSFSPPAEPEDRPRNGQWLLPAGPDI